MPAPLIRHGTKPPILYEAVKLYLECGNYREVGRTLKVDEGAVRRWAQRPEWADIHGELSQAISEEQKAGFRAMIAKGTSKALERLERGDEVVLKGGETVSVPVRARDAAVIASIAMDKLRLLEGRPTRITGSVQALVDLRQQLGREARGATLEGESVPLPSPQAPTAPDKP